MMMMTMMGMESSSGNGMLPCPTSTSSNLSSVFEKAVPVRINKGGVSTSSSSTSSSPAETQPLCDLTVRIASGLDTGQHRSTKVLRVQLTSEVDPFFLYTLEVTEEDFQALKVEQCILVDFRMFPYKFIELLEQCMDAVNLENPRFQAILYVRSSDATLSIIEANQFKHLSHLSLSFRQGNDLTIKNYLAGRLAEFKAATNDLHEKLRRTLLSLEKEQKENDRLNSDLAEIQKVHSQTIQQLKKDYTMVQANESEKAVLEYNRLKENMEKRQADIEKDFLRQDKAQKDQIEDLEKKVWQLLDSKHCLEAKVAELEARQNMLTEDIQERVKECERLRLENCSLDAGKQESVKSLNQYAVRLSALEQEVRDKNEMITSLSKRLEEQTSQRTALEISLKDTQISADRAQEKAEANAAEASKFHQLVDKLQTELRSCKAKMKIKIQAVSQQEKLLLERQMSIDKALHENNILKQDIVDLKTENESAKKKAEEFREQLEEAKEKQKSNQQMIQWLNQQLTDSQLSKFGSSSSVASRHMFIPTQSLDSVTRKGYSFPLSSFSCITNRSLLPLASSPLGQSSVNSKKLAIPDSEPVLKKNGYSDGSCSALTLKANVPLREEQPENSNSSSLLPHNIDSDLNPDSSKQLPAKPTKAPWKLLPRPPPLSFVEAKSELMNEISKA